MKIPRLIFLVFVISLLAACSSGGGGGSTPSQKAPIADTSGTWTITEDGASNCTGETTYHDEYTITIIQSGNNLTVTTPAGTFYGTIDGDHVGWTGSYPEDGGTTTITAMQLTVSADGSSLSGTATWTWSDGVFSCSGTTQAINGTRVPGTGPLPAAPSDLNADAQSQSSIALTWTDNADNETGFKLERSLTQFSGFSQTALLPANQVNYTDSGLDASTTYYYRIRAYNTNGDSGYGTTAAATTYAVTAGPTAPSNLNASANSASAITLTWSDNADDESGFKLERSTAEFTGFIQISLLSANQTSYMDTDLSASTTYYYRIRAYNNDGDSAYSNTPNATTQAALNTPLPPTNLVAAPLSASQISLSWTDNSDNAMGFKIERSNIQDGGFTQIGTATSTEFVNSGLTAATTYYYRVRAYNAAGDSAYSNTASATTSASPVPVSPNNISVSNIAESSARINWNDRSDNETGFEVGRCLGLVASTGDGLIRCVSNFDPIAQLPANTITYLWTGLSASTQYSIFVRAYNNAGPSDNTGISFTTASGSQTVTLRPQYDNLVMTNSLNSATANTVYANAGLSVGCNWIYSAITGLQDFLCAQSLVRFDLSSLSGATIESATLRLTVDYAGVGYYPRAWYIRALASPWSTQTVTWNIVGSTQYYLNSNINQAAPTYAGQVFDINVTALVSNWVNGSWLNNGFLFGLDDDTFPYATSYDAFQFYSNEDPGGDWPKLIITYN